MTGPWAWAGDPRAVMWCVTITRGITPEEVLARYGADAHTARLLTRQQATHLADGDLPEGSVLRAGQVGDWSSASRTTGSWGACPAPCPHCPAARKP